MHKLAFILLSKH